MTAETANILYLIFAIGAVGLYFLMPNPGRAHRGVGATFGLVAVAALMVLLGQRVLGSADSAGFFYLFGSIAVVGAGRVVTHPKPVFSALYFVLVVVAVAALMVLQHAEFLAIALIIIYAGAILITYLFVIMLAQAGGSPVYDRRAREPFLAVMVGFVLMGAIAGRAGDLPEAKRPATIPVTQADTEPATPPVGAGGESNTLSIAAIVMTKYVVVLELSGVLLLVAMIGAIAMSRKQVPTDPYQAPRRPLGEIGKEVEPF